MNKPIKDNNKKNTQILKSSIKQYMIKNYQRKIKNKINNHHKNKHKTSN